MKRLAIGNKKPVKLLGDGDTGFDDSLIFDIASLLNISIGQAKEDCYFYLIQRFMQRIGQVNVRFDLNSGRISDLLYNASVMNTKETLFPPVYISACEKATKKLNIDKNYSVIIDFPFGESVFSNKKIAVGDCVNHGVKSVTVTLPTLLMIPEKLKEFKKQTKKIGVMAEVPIGVALNATDMNDGQIKDALKICEKTRVDFITFIFGDSSREFMIERTALIKKYAGKKVVNVLANVNDADTVRELIKLDVNTVFTPFADDIAKEIIERFGIKKVKLL